MSDEEFDFDQPWSIPDPGRAILMIGRGELDADAEKVLAACLVLVGCLDGVLGRPGGPATKEPVDVIAWCRDVAVNPLATTVLESKRS